MMQFLRTFTAHVQHGRLVLDEPSTLPDGAAVELISIDDAREAWGDPADLDDEERAALDRDLEVSFEEEAVGKLIDAKEVLTIIRKST